MTDTMPESVGVFVPPEKEPWFQPLRQHDLLTRLEDEGYRLTMTVNGPAPQLRLHGPLHRLSDALKLKITAVKDDLLADLEAQRQLAADIVAQIDAAEVWNDLHTAHSRLLVVWSYRALPAAEVTRLSIYLAARSRSVPCSWNQVVIDRYLGSHDGRLTMASRRVARPQSKQHRTRRFAADGSEHQGVVQGELVGIVARRDDVPKDRPDVVWFTIDELARMQCMTPSEVRAVYETKRAFDGEVVE